jgi:hypothetical protein
LIATVLNRVMKKINRVQSGFSPGGGRGIGHFVWLGWVGY